MASLNGFFQFLFSPVHYATSTHACSIHLLSRNALVYLTTQLTIKYSSTSSCQRTTNDQNATNCLHFLRNCNSIESLKKVHSLLIVNGLMGQEFTAYELIPIYLHFTSPAFALLVYSTITRPTLVLQNMVVRCLSDYGFYNDLLSFYKMLQQSGSHRSDNFTFPFVIKACSSLRIPKIGMGIHSLILRTGYASNPVIQTALLDMYAKTSFMDYSRHMFDEISQRDLVSWNALVSGYSSNGLDEEAFIAFRQILMGGLKPNLSTFVSVIPVCTRSGGLQIGTSFHAFTLKCGFSCDDSLASTLISMYAGCNDLYSSKMLFKMLPEKDVVSLNAMISAYVQNLKFVEAFEVFVQMHYANVQPTLISLVSIFPACGNIVNVECGQSVHGCGIKHGFSNQISVVTSLISMYSKLKDVNAAHFLFHTMPEKNLLAWNTMASGYFLNGHWNLGLGAFREMQLAGVVPDSISLVSIISGCCKLEELLMGKSAHAFSIRNFFNLDLNVMNALLNLYASCGHLSVSLSLFNKMPTRNVISWNTLISGYAQIGEAQTLVTLLGQMLQEDVQFDLVTTVSILPTICCREDFDLGMSFHGHAVKSGYDSDTSLSNALITMYINCGDLETGYLLFDRILFKSVVSWNAMLTGFLDCSLLREVRFFLNQMHINGEKPNAVTLLNVIPICRSLQEGKAVHGYAVRHFKVLEASLITSMICMYERFGTVKFCFLLFEVANKGNTVLWNTMMSMYINLKHVEGTIICFREMLEMQLEPDPVTITTLVSACAQIGSQHLAECVTGYVIRCGLESDTSVCNSLIDMHARCGSISMAKKLFEGMTDKDSISWSTMINAYGLHGDGKAALVFFSKMQITGIEPDGITFVSILSSCSHAGLVEEGKMLLKSMTEEYHIEPKMEHYACMVDLLGRTGHLDEAYHLVKSLPDKPCRSLLESLLGACIYHSNTDLGEEIGRLLFELDPESSRSHVMLSNIYAAAGRWTDSSRLRTDMNVRCLRKEPGSSLIEVHSKHIDMRRF